MKFTKFIMIYEDIKKEFEFSSQVNLVSSKKSSVGKSTLLRLLFYSMGYSIPGTKGINFSKVSCTLFIDTSNGHFKLERLNDKVTLKKDDREYSFSVPEETEKLHSIIYNSSNESVISNILGAIYLDQEKGWTLLNKGYVIGRIPFNLSKLIGGLAERSYTDLEIELESVSKELKKYKTMKNIYEYKTNLLDLTNELSSDDYLDELERDLNILKFEKNSLTKKINDIEISIKDNNAFADYIENMRLYIKDGEREILITKDNLSNFTDNQNIVSTRKKLLELKRSKLENKIEKIKLKISKENKLISVQSEIQKFDLQIADLIINPLSIDKIITQLTKRKKELENQIQKIITYNNQLIDSLYLTIKAYAKELNVSKYMDNNKDYIFTNDLKSLSGAVFHKIVFIFKIAYIKEIQNYLNISLPIVLDSPSGREVDQKNISDIMRILNRDFKENQIIIASIYDNYNFDELNKIEITNKLFS